MNKNISFLNPRSAPRNCKAISRTESRKSSGFLGAICNPKCGIRIPHSAFRNGFSFMELMVVVAIMAILIIASMPALRNFTRGRNIKNGAAMVVSALRKTKGASITYRKNYRTVLDTINQAVAIYDNNDDIAEKWERLPEFVEFDPALAGNWHTGIGDPHGNDYGNDEVFWIQFKPSGAVDEVGTIQQAVVLREESTDETRLVTVNALTGRITVE